MGLVNFVTFVVLKILDNLVSLQNSLNTNKCGRKRNFENCDFTFCLSRLYAFKFFKGCIPQFLFCPFLNTLFYLLVHILRIFILILRLVCMVSYRLLGCHEFTVRCKNRIKKAHEKKRE